jgi:DNA-binding transcriptional MerR regulator
LEKDLPLIPAKRYFTIGEVSDLCGVKAHVLRYWEQEFTQLRPMKRRGNRRYYQHHEVLMIRRIRDLLYDQGFTITGARNKLQEIVQTERDKRRHGEVMLEGIDDDLGDAEDGLEGLSEASSTETDSDAADTAHSSALLGNGMSRQRLEIVRRELLEIRDLLAA